ncbi:hypothetical protein GcC1_207045 [Golovinomyces cichoracearum]|uniref:Uncharacterized protein n=1 Tax=Golovinomyces cichoracearum TaxID=62708 RepID=A0A420HC25_9PEZI|nr:hypothetical protein GcC1_207045 [Golovinomyces cichoracearum]
MLIKAFVSGLEDQELRHNAISRGATSTEYLLKTYKIFAEFRRALDEIQKQLAQYTAQQKAEAFDEIYRAPQLGKTQPQDLPPSRYAYNHNSSSAGPSSYQGPPPQNRNNHYRSANRRELSNHTY